MIYRLLIFLLLNFGALAIGGFFTGTGVPSEWYQSLDKAPWTPPGWVFGFAWSFIMVCFSIFMALAWANVANKKKLIGLFILQWVLNVAWNPTFFYFHKVGFGLLIISGLLLLMTYFLIIYRKDLNYKAFLLLPYIIWLIIATSLNAYVLF